MKVRFGAIIIASLFALPAQAQNWGPGNDGKAVRLTVNLQIATPVNSGASAADLTKARALLGYQPQVGLAEGLRRQWEWLSAGEHRSHPAPMEAAR